MATLRATKPHESPGQQSAVEVAAELALDEARIAFAVKPPGLLKEGLEMLADERVRNALLGFAPAVGRR